MAEGDPVNDVSDLSSGTTTVTVPSNEAWAISAWYGNASRGSGNDIDPRKTDGSTTTGLAFKGEIGEQYQGAMIFNDHDPVYSSDGSEVGAFSGRIIPETDTVEDISSLSNGTTTITVPTDEEWIINTVFWSGHTLSGNESRPAVNDGSNKSLQSYVQGTDYQGGMIYTDSYDFMYRSGGEDAGFSGRQI